MGAASASLLGLIVGLGPLPQGDLPSSSYTFQVDGGPAVTYLADGVDTVVYANLQVLAFEPGIHLSAEALRQRGLAPSRPCGLGTGVWAVKGPTPDDARRWAGEAKGLSDIQALLEAHADAMESTGLVFAPEVRFVSPEPTAALACNQDLCGAYDAPVCAQGALQDGPPIAVVDTPVQRRPSLVGRLLVTRQVGQRFADGDPHGTQEAQVLARMAPWSSIHSVPLPVRGQKIEYGVCDLLTAAALASRVADVVVLPSYPQEEPNPRDTTRWARHRDLYATALTSPALSRSVFVLAAPFFGVVDVDQDAPDLGIAALTHAHLAAIYPRVENLMVVGAHGRQSSNLCASPFGEKSVHIHALGSAIRLPGGKRPTCFDGTSLAAAVVAGTIAATARVHGISVHAARARVMKTVDRSVTMECPNVARGILSVANSLRTE
ncbi:MAG: hypothetical protein KC613_06750 [Myxococcales bacterium]|nr:hypothetical protein [Myxococcales bacterium]